MSVNKPSHEEEEYFAKEEATRRHKMASDKMKSMADEERERLKQLHYMKCPKCGHDLETIQFKGFAIEKCFFCNGTWLDAGELEAAAGKPSTVIQKIIDIFRR